jgi:hypothetical protein
MALSIVWENHRWILPNTPLLRELSPAVYVPIPAFVHVSDHVDSKSAYRKKLTLVIVVLTLCIPIAHLV